MHPRDMLRHHITGAIERGEGAAVVCIPAPVQTVGAYAHAIGATVQELSAACGWPLRHDAPLDYDVESIAREWLTLPMAARVAELRRWNRKFMRVATRDSFISPK